MKKLLIFSLVFALASALVVAEVNISAGAGAAFVPVGALMQDGTTEVVTGFGRNGAGELNFEFNIEGTTESGRAGYKGDLRFRNSGFALGDNLKLWIKPLDIIQIEAGKYVNDVLRGKVGKGDWYGDYLTFLGRPGEDAIFTRINNTGMGTSAVVTPVEGLTIFAGLKDIAALNAKPGNNSDVKAQYVWQNIQAGAGFAIPGIGLVRAQYYGQKPPLYTKASTSTVYEIDNEKGTLVPKTITTDDSFNPTFAQLAFALTAVEGLTFDVGAKYYLPIKDPNTVVHALFDKKADGVTDETYNGTVKGLTYNGGIAPALGAKYASGPISLNFILDFLIGKSFSYDTTGTTLKSTEGLKVQSYLSFNYAINDIFAAQVEGGFDYKGKDKDKDDKEIKDTDYQAYGIGVGLQTTVTPGATIKTGVTYTGTNKKTLKDDGTEDKAVITGAISIPVIFSVSF
ncbi:MAG: hypothetical protein LBU18_01295 [Treponema sp.]|jgi:hypothetical protein|nr:hypothetical protein [Treponema sp.]